MRRIGIVSKNYKSTSCKQMGSKDFASVFNEGNSAFRRGILEWMIGSGRHWRWAVTLTFSNQNISQVAADKKLKLFFHRINRRLYGKNCEKHKNRPQLSALVVRELTANGIAHYHLAIEDIGGVRAANKHLVSDSQFTKSFFQRQWEKSGGGKEFRMEEIYDENGWLKYMLKRVIKVSKNNPDPVSYEFLRNPINTGS